MPFRLLSKYEVLRMSYCCAILLHRRESIDLLTESMLGLMELLELRRLLSRCSLGSETSRPLCRPKQFRISVKLTTPFRRPEMGVLCNVDEEALG